MNVWLDEQLSPQLATWLIDRFGVRATHVGEIGLGSARDPDIFLAARRADGLVLTKDQDFVRLLRQQGPPPRILWITCGNSSNARMRNVLEAAFPRALELLEQGEPLVEIGDRRLIAVPPRR